MQKWKITFFKTWKIVFQNMYNLFSDKRNLSDIIFLSSKPAVSNVIFLNIWVKNLKKYLEYFLKN